MQSFSSAAFAAGRRTDLTEPLRYAAQRFGELLDPNAHFAAAATFVLDPVTACGEFIELARAHADSRGHNPSHPVMLDAVERTRAAIVQDPNLASWYPAEQQAALAVLDRAVDWTAASTGRRPWLMSETSAAGRGPVRALWLALADSSGGYRSRLAEHIRSVCATPSLTRSGWFKFDRELRLMAAVALAEGRTDVHLASKIAGAIGRAPDSAAAADRLLVVLEAPQERFIVALALSGVRVPRNVTAFDLRVLKPNDLRWESGVDRGADEALASLHSSTGGTTLLTASVDAFDFDQAVGIAWQRVERLADQYGAQHRTYRIEVTEPVRALRVSDERLDEQTAPMRTVYGARTRLRRPDPRLEQSLRYAALARTERAPVVQVLHAWIALETLARGRGVPTGPYQFLMEHLARALAVHAVRQSLAATWHIASRAGRRGAARQRWLQLERWLGIKNEHRNLPDLNKWVDLMRFEPRPGTKAPSDLRAEASLEEASALLGEMLPTMAPFAREAIVRWRWRLGVGNRLSNWCDAVHGQARATLGRMYAMRNSTVHTALTQAAGAEQLAHAANNVVDAVYEVIPSWMVASQPTWQALTALSRRANHLHRTWNHLSRPALLNAEGLTRPGGDGLSR